MSYSVQPTRDNPTCIVFLVDQSSSMSRPFGAQPDKRKADGVADAINRTLQTLCVKCAKSDGVRDYFHIGVIGYGAQVKPAWGGDLAGQGLVPISKIAQKPLRVETRTKQISDGAGGVVAQSVKFPIWFEPVADGTTPMQRAFELAREWLSQFLAAHPHCFPPMVLNLTDGAADKGQDPLTAAAAVQKLRSSDGEVLVFNAHISQRVGDPILFANGDQGLPDDLARQLFRMSTVLPDKIVDIARSEGYDLSTGARGFVFNADLVAVTQFVDIGTVGARAAKV
jgi:hypothetical protein